MKKVAIFTFNGELMCFAHALFNALDLNRSGYDVKLIIEGSSTALIRELEYVNNPFYKFYKEVESKDIIEGVCKACSYKMGTLEYAKEIGMKLLDEMNGHPSMKSYIDDGYQIITF